MAFMLQLIYMLSVIYTAVIAKPNIIVFLTDDQDILLGGMVRS